MRIGHRDIGFDHPPYIIAEVGVNHDGSPERAVELTRLAAHAGADAVKFQLFEADRLMSRAAKLAAYQKAAGETDPVEMLRRLELPIADLAACASEARRLGIHAIVSVFSVELVGVAEQVAWDAYKTASPDIINKPLLDALAATGKPLIVSTGASTLPEVGRMLTWLRDIHEKLAVLHCVSAYPTPPEHAAPFGVHAIAQIYSGAVGYSDHTSAVEFGRFMVGCRCVMLEKHLTYDRNAKGPDHAASLDPGGFAEYVTQAREDWQNHHEARVMLRELTPEMRERFEREAPGMLEMVARTSRGLDPADFGAPIEKVVLDIEQDVRRVSRQSLTTTRALPAGHTLVRGDLTIKRPGTGIPPYELSNVIGECLARTVEEDMPLAIDDIAGAC